MIPIVTTRAWELVRSQIATILATELPNQSILHADSNLNASVYENRIIPIQNEAMPLVNVSLDSGTWSNFTQIRQGGNYTYNIDIYTQSPSSSNESGDVLSMAKLNKLAGVIQGILMHPNYVTLGFAAPFIEHREVNAVSMGSPTNSLDAENVTMARLSMQVVVPEHSRVIEPTLIAGFDTSVKIGLTDKGYIYSGDNIPIPDPVCEVLTIVINSNNTEVATKIVTDSDNLILLPNIQFTDSDNITSSVPSGVDIIAKQCTPCLDATIQKSDNTLIAEVNSGATYNVADSLIQLDGADGLETVSSVKATDGLILKITNEDLETIPQVYVDGNNLVVEEIFVRNSNNSFSQAIDYINENLLPDVTHTDSDGSGVTLPGMIPMVCTPQVKDLFLNLNYNDTNDIIEVLGNSSNAGTYTTIASGLTYSTDGTTYVSIPNPFTMVSATQYYFKRDTPTETETKTLQGTYV